jgi:hypothetical protein
MVSVLDEPAMLVAPGGLARVNVLRPRTLQRVLEDATGLMLTCGDEVYTSMDHLLFSFIPHITSPDF